MAIPCLGLPLLQAKNSTGFTPTDLSISEEMEAYLKTAEKNLIHQSSTLPSESMETRQQDRILSDDIYFKVLGRKGCRNARHISPEKCQEYVLLLSQLVQGYVRLHNLGGIASNNGCNTEDKSNDYQVMMKMHDHVDNLKHHLQAITIGSQLTLTCKVRVENMKFV